MRSHIDCTKCRKAIYQEAKEAYLKNEYAFFSDSVHSLATFTTVAVLAVMERRGRSPEYIKKLYDDICFMYDYPEIFGKQLTMTELIHKFEKEYEIDFSKIKVHIESEKEFVKEMKHCDERKY